MINSNFIKILSLITLLFVTGVANADLNDGLLAYYSFEGNGKDESGNGNNGNEHGNIVYVQGKLGQAAKFDGIDDYFQINTSEQLRSKHYSISFWVQTNSTRERIAIFSALYSNGSADASGYQVGLGINSSMYPEYDGKIVSDHMTAATGNWGASSSIPVNDGQWYHVTVTYDGSISKLYLNGSLDSTFDPNNYSHDYWPGNVRWSPPFHDFYIGKNETGTNYVLYDGLIDELRIYNRAITESEIQNIYNYDYINTVTGSIVTDSDILGYTASVGGATIIAFPDDISATTNIYGEFELMNLPIGSNTLQIISNYFQSITKNIQIYQGKNNIGRIELYKPKCQNLYTQAEMDKIIQQITLEKDQFILEKEKQITQLNDSIATMYTKGYLDQAILEAEKRGELKYDINNDGKVGLEEIIKYLETLSGVRLESLIIFPGNKKHFLSE